ncbi:hypothetical protein F4802DRAFT_522059 [Xylaria palmicola]|nr:hypothetical protein F4802DRAFT_522059 [Xylaria palmicola]
MSSYMSAFGGIHQSSYRRHRPRFFCIFRRVSSGTVMAPLLLVSLLLLFRRLRVLIHAAVPVHVLQINLINEQIRIAILSRSMHRIMPTTRPVSSRDPNIDCPSRQCPVEFPAVRSPPTNYRRKKTTTYGMFHVSYPSIWSISQWNVFRAKECGFTFRMWRASFDKSRGQNYTDLWYYWNEGSIGINVSRH